MTQKNIAKPNKIREGKTYWHDGMVGIATITNGVYYVKSGSDGYYPLDVIKWGGELRRAN